MPIECVLIALESVRNSSVTQHKKSSDSAYGECQTM